jgi:hypothetical protein
MKNAEIEKVHISTIRIGDTVKHEGEIKTICKNVLKYSSFLGFSIFGDSYNLGHKKVEKITFKKLKNEE